MEIRGPIEASLELRPLLVSFYSFHGCKSVAQLTRIDAYGLPGAAVVCGDKIGVQMKRFDNRKFLPFTCYFHKYKFWIHNLKTWADGTKKGTHNTKCLNIISFDYFPA